MANDFVVSVDLGAVPGLMNAIVQARGLRDGLREAAIYFKGKSDNYPAQMSVSRASVYGQTFFSDVQRRYFFAALNAGDITVPYQRRGAGGLAGKFGIEEQDGGLAQVIGNNASYAPLVIGERRTRIHERIGWKTMEEVYRAEEAAIQRIVQNYVGRMIDEA